jgi:NTE family protein
MPDALVVIPVNVCSFYEFYRGKEMIDYGYQMACEQLPGLLNHKERFEESIPPSKLGVR